MQEIINKRTLNSKTYQDGNKYTSKYYMHPIHYNNNGVLDDIDVNFEFESGFGDKIKKAKHNIKFKDNLFRFGFAKNVYIDYTLPTNVYTKSGNKIVYENAWSNVDLEYVPFNQGVKNNIILKNNHAQTSFNFPVDLKNCSLEIKGNSAVIKDGSNIVGIIPVPFMTDANYKPTLGFKNRGKVTLSFKDNVLTFTADEGWLKTAVYPVKIDPTTYNPTDDENEGCIYYESAEEELVLNIYNGGLGKYENVDIKNFALFPNVAIPQGATIDSATLKYYLMQSDNASTIPTKIYGNDVNDAVAPTTVSEYNNLVKTTAYVSWNCPILDSEEDTSVTTADISTVVKEIVDRAGWASGNNMQFIHETNGGTNEIFIITYTQAYVNFYGGDATEFTVSYSSGSTNASVTSVINDVDLYGKAPSISAVKNVSITSVVTDTDLYGKAPTITTIRNVSISGISTNNALSGVVPSIVIVQSASVTSVVGSCTLNGIASVIEVVFNTGVNSVIGDSVLNVVNPSVTAIQNVNIIGVVTNNQLMLITPSILAVKNASIECILSDNLLNAVVSTITAIQNVNINSIVSDNGLNVIIPTVLAVRNIEIIFVVSNSNLNAISPTISNSQNVNVHNVVANIDLNAIVSDILAVKNVEIECLVVDNLLNANNPVIEAIQNASIEHIVANNLLSGISSIISIVQSIEINGVVGNNVLNGIASIIEAIQNINVNSVVADNQLNVIAPEVNNIENVEIVGVVTNNQLEAMLPIIECRVDVSINSVVININLYCYGSEITTVKNTEINSISANNSLNIISPIILAATNTEIVSIVNNNVLNGLSSVILTTSNILIHSIIGNNVLNHVIPTINVIAHIVINSIVSNLNSIFKLPIINTDNSYYIILSYLLRNPELSYVERSPVLQVQSFG